MATNHEGEASSLGKSREKTKLDKDMKPQKMQERD